MLTVVGGTYIEVCTEPYWYELYGSGLRGAIAISNCVDNLKFISYVGEKNIESAKIICSTFNIEYSFLPIEKTISFEYYHPLSKPKILNYDSDNPIDTLAVSDECVLIYGQLEAKAKVKANYVVYDPQNKELFDPESQIEHLALVLNKQEAMFFSNTQEEGDIISAGKNILSAKDAEVVVIKNGSEGAWVFDKTGHYHVPVFKTNNVFPIGSGDVFSAVFAREWAVMKNSPIDAARIASLSTAYYCDKRLLPIPHKIDAYEPIIIESVHKKTKIYLAAPFFSISERWLNNEVIRLLKEFNNEVFSPFHDVGFGESAQVAFEDLEAMRKADLIFAVLTGSDPGTIFEVGYAKAIGKKVLILAEKMHDIDLTMFTGTDCEIIDDLSTAIYKASWLV